MLLPSVAFPANNDFSRRRGAQVAQTPRPRATARPSPWATQHLCRPATPRQRVPRSNNGSDRPLVTQLRGHRARPPASLCPPAKPRGTDGRRRGLAAAVRHTDTPPVTGADRHGTGHHSDQQLPAGHRIATATMTGIHRRRRVPGDGRGSGRPERGFSCVRACADHCAASARAARTGPGVTSERRARAAVRQRRVSSPREPVGTSTGPCRRLGSRPGRRVGKALGTLAHFRASAVSR